MFDGFGLYILMIFFIALLLLLYICAMTVILLIAYAILHFIKKLRGKKDEQV